MTKRMMIPMSEKDKWRISRCMWATTPRGQRESVVASVRAIVLAHVTKWEEEEGLYEE